MGWGPVAGGKVKVKDEGTDIIETDTIDFKGAGVTATSGGSKADVDIPGGGAGADTKVNAFKNGVQVGTVARQLDFRNGLDVQEDSVNDQFDILPIYGSSANTICQGNDSRLSDARTPLAHTSSHSPAGSDPLQKEVVSGQTEDVNPDPDNDSVLIYDNSTSALKKVLLKNASGVRSEGKDSSVPVNNSTVLKNDEELFIALKANTKYAFEYFLRVQGPSTADIDITFVGPTGSVGGFQNHGEPNSELSLGTEKLLATGASSPADKSGLGFITTGGTAGNLQLQWAQNVAVVGDSEILAGSWLAVMELV